MKTYNLNTYFSANYRPKKMHLMRQKSGKYVLVAGAGDQRGDRHGGGGRLSAGRLIGHRCGYPAVKVRFCLQSSSHSIGIQLSCLIFCLLLDLVLFIVLISL